ncbi:ribosomal protein S21 [Kwoniella heveanensis CBS 569]|uniref:Ribosomal protein S21 n=1 Tax=Kwoniella heveanensis BCC8398 TaxID=1296120 RepID=A0A1B9GNF3_9TREE|nr:ribosomal protein S21 [Kwoniella heveanensis BCC8398]OCF40714.1 ribosomal protein S21 [Kwoniella heveanensis CBS 569]
MSFLARSALALRAVSAPTSSSSRAALIPISPLVVARSLRFNSTLPPPPSASSSPETALPPKSSELFGSSNVSDVGAGVRTGTPNFQNLKFDIPSSSSSSLLGSSSSSNDPEAWWRERSNQAAQEKKGYPTTISTGRSIPVSRNGDFMTAYKRLQGLIRNSNLKKEARLTEYHEKPSVRRRRLISERHRRRFKEMVRTKVQQVISMRHRG